MCLNKSCLSCLKIIYLLRSDALGELWLSRKSFYKKNLSLFDETKWLINSIDSVISLNSINIRDSHANNLVNNAYILKHTRAQL